VKVFPGRLLRRPQPRKIEIPVSLEDEMARARAEIVRLAEPSYLPGPLPPELLAAGLRYADLLDRKREQEQRAASWKRRR